MEYLPARRGGNPCRAARAVDDPVGLLHEGGNAGRGAVSPVFPSCWRAMTEGFTGVPTTATKPMNRAKRHWRWPAYHCCRARSLVRLGLVASIPGDPPTLCKPCHGDIEKP